MAACEDFYLAMGTSSGEYWEVTLGVGFFCHITAKK